MAGKTLANEEGSGSGNSSGEETSKVTSPRGEVNLESCDGNPESGNYNMELGNCHLESSNRNSGSYNINSVKEND
jgi:hypothetical protein